MAKTNPAPDKADEPLSLKQYLKSERVKLRQLKRHWRKHQKAYPDLRKTTFPDRQPYKMWEKLRISLDR